MPGVKAGAVALSKVPDSEVCQRHSGGFLRLCNDRLCQPGGLWNVRTERCYISGRVTPQSLPDKAKYRLHLG